MVAQLTLGAKQDAQLERVRSQPFAGEVYRS